MTIPATDRETAADDLTALPEWLAVRLTGELPPETVRARFAPTLSYGRHFGPPAYDARTAAVLILLYPGDGGWHLPLTVRPATMLAHAGQISLPGGMVESGETTRDAALRELHEELGVAPEGLAVLGSLSPLNVFVSNFVVTPWLAVAGKTPQFTPCEREVAAVLEVPLAHLLDPANVGARSYRRGELEFTAPHFQFGEHLIWGATGIVLAEMVALCQEYCASPSPRDAS